MLRFARLFGAFVLIAVSATLHFGSVQAQPNQAETFTLQPGGQATITFEAFCTDFGLAFPTTVDAPDALGSAEIRNAIAYIAAQDFANDPASALDAQYGLWRIAGAADSPQGGQIANDVVNAATTAVQDPQGTSLLDAAQAGQVTVTIDSWESLGEQVEVGTLTDYFYGRGTMTAVNTSDQELTLYHPVGALLAPGEAGAQTMASYATDIQVNNPQPTPQPTTQATAQPTSEASAQQPSQLPTTAASGTAGVMPLLGFVAIALVGIGWVTLRRTHLGGRE